MAKILAVDDSNSIRQMVTFTLEGVGHEVTEAVDGVEALKVAKNESFDLVLSDINMPNMDGITLIKELRALPDFAHTPVLVLTTESDVGKKQAGREAGATGWILKPFNPDQLLKVIKKVLD